MYKIIHSNDTQKYGGVDKFEIWIIPLKLELGFKLNELVIFKLNKKVRTFAYFSFVSPPARSHLDLV